MNLRDRKEKRTNKGVIKPGENVRIHRRDDRTLERFVKAQEKTYDQAIEEMKNGQKWGHWMWFIFPQIEGLGHSEIAQFYGIKDLREAKEYLMHPILGKRLVNICHTVLLYEGDNASLIFGSPDDMKLQSSMTLFHRAAPEVKVFTAVLTKFFSGREDYKTLNILGLEPGARLLEVEI